MSRRQAAKHFNLSRDSVAKMMAYSTPPGYQRQSPVRRPKLDAFVSTIDHWLDKDIKLPRKQRHTAKRVFDRLRDERGFTGGYTIIKDYMREREQRRQEVFVPLSHARGHGQADFGEAMVVIGGVERKAHFFVLDLPHSDGCYVRAYPAAVSEAWVDGHVHAFAFFGAVPQSIVYDNDRCLVAKILPDGTRKRATLSGFLSHHLIRDRYARPGKGNDKGSVEGLVGYARRNFMVPIPEFATWEAFNAWLEEQCRKRQRDRLRGESETIRERLLRDVAAMRALAASPFDACDQASAKVTAQSLVRYKTNDYSVPVAYGRREYVQVLRLLESFELADLHAAVKQAIQLGAIGFDAVKHLILCRVERRPPRLDLSIYPYLPRATVETTSAKAYMRLLSTNAGEAA
ncbi:IS21 family transposase [Hoeflea sp. IMCC20628]|uniref:IS21 family transposase n=1 Tax=Hoeflea sp. IMCC20628 TaxID=1620421 RepID=UPI0009E4F2A7|nr:IS21 family transposase [Hoeflea sp. IMCC20628]